MMGQSNTIAQTRHHADMPLYQSDDDRLLRSYVDLLRVQARLQFPFERFLFSNSDWQSAETVLDFGCGDGSYLQKLSEVFPGKKFLGYDVNLRMLEVAKRNNKSLNVAILDHLDQCEQYNPEFVLMRYVVMHIHERQQTLSDLAEQLPSGASILVIEPDDQASAVSPKLSVLELGLAGIKEVSKARNLKALLDQDFVATGFNLVNTADCTISNAIPSVEIDILRYLHALSELGLQRSLSTDEKSELLDWHMNEEHSVKFGFHARQYRKTG